MHRIPRATRAAALILGLALLGAPLTACGSDTETQVVQDDDGEYQAICVSEDTGQVVDDEPCNRGSGTSAIWMFVPFGASHPSGHGYTSRPAPGTRVPPHVVRTPPARAWVSNASPALRKTMPQVQATRPAPRPVVVGTDRSRVFNGGSREHTSQQGTSGKSSGKSGGRRG